MGQLKYHLQGLEVARLNKKGDGLWCSHRFRSARVDAALTLNRIRDPT